MNGATDMTGTTNGTTTRTNPTPMLRPLRTLTGLLVLATPLVQAADLILDNGSAQFSTVGTWPTSTGTAGYEGTNYQYHAGRPTTLIVDNLNGSATGTWALSTNTPGYYGSNYQTHAAGTGSNIFTWPLAVTATSTSLGCSACLLASAVGRLISRPENLA